MTKQHRPWGLHNRNSMFSQSLQAGSSKSRCYQVWFLLRLLSLACRRARGAVIENKPRPRRGSQSHWVLLWHSRQQMGTSMYRGGHVRCLWMHMSICRECWSVAWAALCWGIHYGVQKLHVGTDKIQHIVEIILPILSFFKMLFILSWLCLVFCCVWAFLSCSERGPLCVWASYYSGFLWQSTDQGARASVAGHRLSCPSTCGIFLTRDWTCVPCIGRGGFYPLTHLGFCHYFLIKDVDLSQSDFSPTRTYF